MPLIPKFLRASVLTLSILLAQSKESIHPQDSAPAISVEEWLQVPLGSQTSLEQWKGRVIVLEFWATWCGPCVAAIPQLNALVSHFQNKPIQFISITDEERWRIEKFLKLRPMSSWIGLNPSRSTFDRYGVEALPRTVVIDSQGSIAAIGGPNDLTESLLEGVLARKPVVSKATVSNAQAAIRPLLEMLVRSAQPGHSMKSTPSEITAQGARLRDIVGFVYQFSSARIEIPPVIAETTYDVSFIVPVHRQNSLARLAQDALSTALGLTITRARQVRDVLVLTAPTGTAGLRRSPQQSLLPILSDNGQVAGKSMPLRNFAAVLESTLHQPVLDETGSQGFFDLALYWDAGKPDSVIKATHEQLHLDLTPARQSIDVLVVKSSAP